MKKPKKYIIILFLQYKGLYTKSFDYLTKYELLNIVNDHKLQWELLDYDSKMSRYEIIKSQLSLEEQEELSKIEKYFNP